MRLRFAWVALAFCSMALSLASQTATSDAVAATAQVPRLVRFNGTLSDVSQSVAGGVVGVTFSLYSEQTGGVPLWSEVQNVKVDSAGHYNILLGSTKPDGLPVELFSSVQAQWLGVRQEGHAEQPRVMLLSVPYALKAADAETFGGQPPSAFARASTSGEDGLNGVGLLHQQKADGPGLPLSLTGNGAPNFVALWSNPSTLTNSLIYQSPSRNIGIGTTNPEHALTVVSSTTAIDGQSGLGASAFGVNGSSASSTGAGVAGIATSSSGNTAGVSGASNSTTGAGVFASATSTAGANFGVLARSASTSGTGVMGVATSTTGTVYGVHGTTPSTGGSGVLGEATSTTGVVFGVEGTSPSSGGIGVNGTASSNSGHAYGVQGTTESTDGVGVIGFANNPGGVSSGVSGQNSSSTGIGVFGNEMSSSGAAYGVRGNSASPDGFGVAGLNSAATGVAVGVEGQTNSSDGYGVAGTATSSSGNTIGVYGDTSSTAGVGVYGVGFAPSNESTSARPIGVWGDTGDTSGGGAGVVGTADNAVAVAGYNKATNHATALFKNDETTRNDASVVIARGTGYNGLCFFDVSGNVICNGSKSAMVPVDGGTRQVLLYAVESAENWFEDVGSARLANGSAVVRLDPTFAQTVNTGMEYHVFLTPKGDCKGLYVSHEGADSFEVHELGGGHASLAFDYRIMARRKGYEEIRLADKTEVMNQVMKESVAPSRAMVRRSPELPDGSPAYPAATRTERRTYPSMSYPQAAKQ